MGNIKQVLAAAISASLLIACLQAQAGESEEVVVSSDKSWTQSTLPAYVGGVPEISVMKYILTPGVKTPIHLHPVNAGGYVVSGQLTMYATNDAAGNFSDPSNVKTIVLNPGDGWTETVNTWHYGVATGDVPTEVVIVFAGQKGTPTGLTLGTYIQPV